MASTLREVKAGMVVADVTQALSLSEKTELPLAGNFGERAMAEIVYVIRRVEASTPVGAPCRRLGGSDATLKWASETVGCGSLVEQAHTVRSLATKVYGPSVAVSGDTPLLGRDEFEPTRTPIEHGVTHVHLMSKLRMFGIYDIRGKL
jgi:hypothetical protein